jgi:hypothetical protein
MGVAAMSQIFDPIRQNSRVVRDLESAPREATF